jgi:hypothetical protein
VVVVQSALTTMHSSGQMVEHGYFDTNSPLAQKYFELPEIGEEIESGAAPFLSDLSEGKFIPDWDRELRKESRIRLIARKIVHTALRRTI